MKLSDVKKGSKFNLLQTGMPGAGKTTRACSALRFGKVLIIDADNKFGDMGERLKDRFGAVEAEAKIEFLPIKDGKDWDDAIKNIKVLSEGFSTIVVDTLNRAYELMITELKKQVKDGRQAYMLGLPKMKEHLMLLSSLPQNLILNNHVANDLLPDGTSKLIATTEGKLGGSLPGYFNEVHYCYLDPNSKRKVRGEPSPGVDSRTVRNKALLDSFGVFKVDDLSIFDDIAYRGPQKA